MLGAPLADSPLVQLADPNSERDSQWDRELDRYLLNRLMEPIAPRFEPTTLAAFRRLAVDDLVPARAAEELGLSLNAVLIAKSRVLTELRAEAEALIDCVWIFLKGLPRSRTS